MSRFFMLLAGVGLVYQSVSAQVKYTLSGVVLDENRYPVIGADVVMRQLEIGSVTDDKGHFVISGIKAGTYSIEISFFGYEPIFDTLTINADTTYDAQFPIPTNTLDEIVITDFSVIKQKKEEALGIDIVDNTFLMQNLGGSLMKSLERLAGVSTIDIGSGQSKPVIRGLSFNRVVVVENQIKHEAQQWGAEHGLEIDQYAVDRIEVIKGPGSLIYGSDAIGGVIDMKGRAVPLKNSIGGTIDFTGKTNNDFMGTSLSLYGRKDLFFFDFRVTLTDFGDYKVPTDSVDIYSYRAALYRHHLRNTAGNERNLHLSFGVIRPRFQSKFYISNFNGKAGFFANAHGLEPRNVDTGLHDSSNRDILYPFQEVTHFKVIHSNQYKRGRMKLESDLGLQRNYRQEWSPYVNHGYMPAVFPDTLSFRSDLEQQFDKYVFSGNLKLHYDINDKTGIVMGISGEHQDNRIDGRAFIIPAFRQLNAGGFVFGTYAFTKKSIVQAGLRYDYGHIATSAYFDWFPSPVFKDDETVYDYLKRADSIDRQFSNLSWSLGYNYNPGKWILKANVGKSFRMPIVKELAANGVNYHRFSYETGNADLQPEISYQMDVGVEYVSSGFTFGASPFVNYFSNYIYLNPSSEHDRLYGNGNQVFYYTQCRVFRYGSEIHADYHVSEAFTIGMTGEYVYSLQLSGEKKGFTLPFSPPASLIVNAAYHEKQLAFIGNAYLSVDYRLTSAQNNIVPPEETTKGFQTLDVGLGGELKLGNQKAGISMQIQNLLNSTYFNHTSYYRLIQVPEPGRNFILTVSIPVSVKTKPNSII
jgi:iron complex outermembrane receptor protein